ncbi:hypothetical protein TspCOW1_04810 [Thiohalobacter sp. COW1]|uniref:FkbM family methyltransferase n=1 Tax=Thiohalobacter sp. COW1 TaxID=2795687 RepID=UPI001915F81C|nr:FkbM family methyltransferase [Thiohalobacter sp. COW1]BCO30378.1 hypothetical protein TspCOW1_04810 [Thiohalobacter sp. COW1]
MKRRIQLILLSIFKLVNKIPYQKVTALKHLNDYLYFLYKEKLEAGDISKLEKEYIPNSAIIDVGANIGFFTLLFSGWAASSSGRVIAIEPEMENYHRLCRNIERADRGCIVHCINAAASDTNSEHYLKVNPDHPGDHQLAESGIPVNGFTLDRIADSHNLMAISLIKVDVQGAELKVINGARNIILRDKPALYLEISDNDLLRHGASEKELFSVLEELGYELKWTNPPHDHKSASAGVGYYDALFRHRDRGGI